MLYGRKWEITLYCYVVLITLCSATISCAYILPNSGKYPVDGIIALCNCKFLTKDESKKVH